MLLKATSIVGRFRTGQLKSKWRSLNVLGTFKSLNVRSSQLDATFAVAKRKPEKIQACTGFKPLTSAILVQHSN